MDSRLSNLPEPLLTHIMSFLPTNDAVRTSVLSSQWNYLWTTVTTLNLDDRPFLSRDRAIGIANFMNFVERVLIFGNPITHNFYLTLTYQYDANCVHSWISAAIRRNVRKLTIWYYHCQESFIFPRCLYYSDSLTELNLQMFCTLSVPTSTCFSSLKILKLDRVTFFNECFSLSTELHFSFPLLEVLSLNVCKWQKVKVVNIDAPKINTFTMNDYQRQCDFAVKIHGSSLEKYKWGGYPFVDFILPSQSSVIDADIMISFLKSDQKLKMGLFTSKLLGQFSSLKYLTLCIETIETLAYVEDFQNHLPVINNLIKLTVWGSSFWTTTALSEIFIALLQSFPVLESLICTQGISWFNNHGVVHEVVPPCFHTHLKVVKVKVKIDGEHQLKLVKFLLKNATVLEEMIITYDDCFRKPSKRKIEALRKQVLAFPRGSDHASISLK